MDRAIRLDELRRFNAHLIHDWVDWVSLSSTPLPPTDSIYVISSFSSNDAGLQRRNKPERIRRILGQVVTNVVPNPIVLDADSGIHKRKCCCCVSTACPKITPRQVLSDHARCEGNVDGIASLRSSVQGKNSSSQRHDNQLVWWLRASRCGNYRRQGDSSECARSQCESLDVMYEQGIGTLMVIVSEV
eukprot:scaffold14654_cov50-Cyclotella_meneghiniana.AAC.9